MADDLKKRLMGAIGEALTRRFMGGKKFDLSHLPDVTLDALATTLPEFLGISDEHREWLEGALQGVVDRVTAEPDLASDKKGLMGLINDSLKGPKGDKGGGTSQIVDGLTAIAGMTKEAKTAYTAMMALPDADALIDRLMAVQTTPKTLESAFLMPTPDLQRKTFEKILTKIEADAAKAKAPKAVGKGPLAAFAEKARGVLDRAEAAAVGVRTDRLRDEAAELRRRHPAAGVVLDDPTDYAALVARAEKDPYDPLTLTQAYERMHP